jgi:transposase
MAWRFLSQQVQATRGPRFLMAYSSSLTDAEWDILEPLLPEILPPKKSTRPLEWSYREIIDGILYRLKNGCNWADLPNDLPPYSTVYWHSKTLAFTMGLVHPIGLA